MKIKIRMILLTIGIIVSSCRQESKPLINSTGENETPINEKYSYNVKGCEYSVSFNKKPQISQSKADGITFERAEVENSLSYMRCESIVYDDLSLLENIDKDYIFSVFDQYANAEGLDNPGYDYEETELGKTAQMIAFKTITRGQRVQVSKYVVRAYYGDRSAIFIYTLCPSDNWPTTEVQEFLNSLKRT